MSKKYPRYSNEEISIIKRVYPEGGTKELKKLINRSSDSIRHKVSELGVKRVDGFRDSKIDFSDLINPKTKEAAYLLGLIWGDGTVSFGKNNRGYNISVTLAEQDFNDVKPLLKRFHIFKVVKQKNSWKQCYRAHVGHKKLALFLKSKDFCLKSIKTPSKILSLIPDKHKGYFVRGWFDADGSNNELLKTAGASICIAGSFSQSWTSLHKICKSLGIKRSHSYKQIGKRGRGSIYRFGGHFNILRFRKFLYPNGIDGIGFKRKALNFFNKKEPKRVKALRYK